jgi:uncharacterized membrane protein YfcA
MPLLLLLFLFGISVGTFSGLLGLGGGIVLIPGLMLLFGFGQQEAQGTTLAVLVPPIGLAAAIVYYQNGYVRLPVVGWLAAGFLIGAFLGAKLLPYIPPVTLRVAFGILLLYAGFFYVMTPRTIRPAAALPSALGAVAAAVLARWVRRPPKTIPAPPPGREIEYHI